jgi:diguanylate cyclase (GGDEF)-like protein
MSDRVRTALRSLRVQVSLALLVGASLCALAASRSSHDELAGAYAEGARAVLRAVADEARTDLERVGPGAAAAPAAAERARALRRRHPRLREARFLAARPPGLAGRGHRYGERDDRRGHVATLVTAIGRDGALVLAYDLDRTDAALAARSRRLLLVLSALLLGFTAFTALVLGRAIFGPLARLRLATQDLAGGRLGARLGWGRRDELGVLARDFDAMAAELERNDGRLRRMAHADPLTGLANHRRFRERLGEEVAAAAAAGEPLSVVALDIDHFKRINDAGGHPAGDAVLRAVAGALTTAAGERGLAARLGGDEFALLLPGAGADTARTVARAVCAAVAAARPTGTDVSCSAGLAAFPDDAEDAAALVELADGALYWAKRSGRGGGAPLRPRARHRHHRRPAGRAGQPPRHARRHPARLPADRRPGHGPCGGVRGARPLRHRRGAPPADVVVRERPRARLRRRARGAVDRRRPRRDRPPRRHVRLDQREPERAAGARAAAGPP